MKFEPFCAYLLCFPEPTIFHDGYIEESNFEDTVFKRGRKNMTNF